MKKLLSVLLVLAMIVAFVGCSAKPAAEQEATTADAQAAAIEAVAEATAEPAADDQCFIGLAMHNQTETWAVAFADAFKAAAEAAGCKVAVTDANATASNQVSQIEDLVTQGIDVLVVLPADYTALGSALKTAYDAGVKIVDADSKVVEADQSMVSCFVTADCYKAATPLANTWPTSSSRTPSSARSTTSSSPSLPTVSPALRTPSTPRAARM